VKLMTLDPYRRYFFGYWIA